MTFLRNAVQCFPTTVLSQNVGSVSQKQLYDRHMPVCGYQDHQRGMNGHGERSTAGAQKRVAGKGTSTWWDGLHTHAIFTLL